jgi:hypothetical protein
VWILGYGLDSQVLVLVRARSFTSHSIQSGSGAHSASNSLGIGGTFSQGKVAWSGADFSSPSCAEGKNVFMVWCLIKHWDNFTYYYVDVGDIADISETHAASIRVDMSWVSVSLYIGY